MENSPQTKVKALSTFRYRRFFCARRAQDADPEGVTRAIDITPPL
jgi:hypothetical protein